MNAELALWLVEQGIDLANAKRIAEEARTTDDVAFALLEAQHGAITVPEARELAQEAPVAPTERVQRAALATLPAASAGPVMGEHDTDKVAHGTYAPVVGPDGLTDKQRAALGKVGLCPNCQQPNDDHLPGCARVSTNGYEPMDPKARTKDPLPPAV